MDGPRILNNIQPPVVIDIAELRIERKRRRIQSRFSAHLGKRAVSVIAEQLRPAQGIREKQIGVAVVVVIAPGMADRGPARNNSRLLRNVGERAIAIVVKQFVLHFAVEQSAQVRADKKVQLAIAIVIHPRAAK